jgi:hypothetical protein
LTGIGAKGMVATAAVNQWLSWIHSLVSGNLGSIFFISFIEYKLYGE